MANIPKDTLQKVKQYLEKQKSALESRLTTLRREDPFAQVRITTNASPDADAAEETGHDRVVAMRQEANRLLARIKQALAKIGVGTYGKCDRCDKDIDPARLHVMPMANLCLACEQRLEE